MTSTYKDSSGTRGMRDLPYLFWITTCVYKTKRLSSSDRQVETESEDQNTCRQWKQSKGTLTLAAEM